MRKWLALFVLVIGLTVGLSKADGQQIGSGLDAVGYSISDVPPLRSDTAYPQCASGVYEQINYTWDYEQNLFGDCGWDSFMIHYTGAITIPRGVRSVRFGIASDDGSDVTIDGVNFGLWADKGCSVDYSDRVVLPTGEPLKLDAFFYENGGGTCFMLFWQFDNDYEDWAVVPAWAFSSDVVEPTTTTEEPTTTQVPTTTSTSTTTTVLKTTTTTTPPTTTEPRTTTTSTTSTSVAPKTTTSTSTTTTTTEPETTTTATPRSTTTSVVSPVEPTSTVPPTTTTTTIPSTTTTLPPLDKPELVSPAVAELLTNAAQLPQTEIQKAVDNIVADGISKSEATMLSSNPDIIASVTPEQAHEIFNAVDQGTLTDAQGAAIVEAVQLAPVEIRNQFESAINVYDGHTDTYVPVGSLVTVKQRRVIIVTGLALVAVPVLPARKQDE